MLPTKLAALSLIKCSWSLLCRSLPADARAFEVAVEMALARLIALFEQPAVAAVRIAQDLPAIAVGVPEKEAIGAVLQTRFRDLLELPVVALGADGAVCLVDLLLGADIEPVMVEEVHFADILAEDDRDRVWAA